MLTRDTIKTVFGVDSPVSDEMTKAVELWSQMYANMAPWVTGDIVSLNLPVAIASEIARLATIEAEVKVEGSARADWLNVQMEGVLDVLRKQVEYGVALGGMVFKPYVNDTGQIVVNYVQADSFYPVDFDDSGQLMGAIFVDKRFYNNSWYTKFEYHQMIGPNCQIQNMAFKSNEENTLGVQVPLNSIPEWATLLSLATIQNIPHPLFAYFRYPIANNIDPSSYLGVSCYSRAVNLIEQADKQWSNFLWEFESGKRALYVDQLAFKQDANGNPILPNKKLYRTIDAGGQEDALFKDWSPTFRQSDILMGLNNILKHIEFATGLAYGTLSDPQEIEKTATEILSAKQRTYTTVVDTQKALQDTLEDLVFAIDTWATLNHLAPAGTYEVSYYFDDSTIVDKDLRFKRDLQLVNTGIMSKLEFRMRNLNEPEDMARKMIAQSQAEQPALEFPTGG